MGIVDVVTPSPRSFILLLTPLAHSVWSPHTTARLAAGSASSKTVSQVAVLAINPEVRQDWPTPHQRTLRASTVACGLVPAHPAKPWLCAPGPLELADRPEAHHIDISPSLHLQNFTAAASERRAIRSRRKGNGTAKQEGRTRGVRDDLAKVQVATIIVAAFATARYLVLTNTLILYFRGGSRPRHNSSFERPKIRHALERELCARALY
ncbi:hypothetical protein EW146_g8987 [Bondarzewia mesenterica]|uniref:Uncharacterized protein n=1 Tax=Bondarzewia mesenterica TaxID=1095465 RepID=A0A4S4LBD8_9AGAM|nr:hypothetical protein EW146_g8987 [Bondarzewia mesenterica]